MFRRSLLLAVLLALPLAARTRPTSPLDPDYIAALTVANNFLHAWQTHDAETGILLLSDPLREHSSTDAVSLFFSARQQQTYEIARGRRLSLGRYQFPVTLWQAPNSGVNPRPKPRATTLILTLTPKDDWLVDNLP